MITRYKKIVIRIILAIPLIALIATQSYAGNSFSTLKNAGMSQLFSSGGSNNNSSTPTQKKEQQLNNNMNAYKTSQSQQRVAGQRGVNQQAASSDSVLQGQSLEEQAFAQTVKTLIPLTPQQIKILKKLYVQSRKAAAETPGTPPRPTSTALSVSLAPSATPPVIRLSRGFISSITLLDSTGQPWPIQSFDVGDPKSFNVQWGGEPHSNVLLVQAITAYQTGNIAVMLKGLNTPIMISLMPGQQAVDYRTDLRIQGLGPDAKPQINGMPNSGSPDLLQVLNGIPPEESQRMIVDAPNTQAWVQNNKLFLRTPLTVVSPSWIASMTSGDGTHVYEMKKTPVLLASQNGSIITVHVQSEKIND